MTPSTKASILLALVASLAALPAFPMEQAARDLRAMYRAIAAAPGMAPQFQSNPLISQQPPIQQVSPLVIHEPITIQQQPIVQQPSIVASGYPNPLWVAITAFAPLALLYGIRWLAQQQVASNTSPFRDLTKELHVTCGLLTGDLKPAGNELLNTSKAIVKNAKNWVSGLFSTSNSKEEPNKAQEVEQVQISNKSELLALGLTAFLLVHATHLAAFEWPLYSLISSYTPFGPLAFIGATAYFGYNHVLPLYNLFNEAYQAKCKLDSGEQPTLLETAGDCINLVKTGAGTAATVVSNLKREKNWFMNSYGHGGYIPYPLDWSV